MHFNEKLFKTKHVGIVIQNDCHEKWIAIFKILTITYYLSLRIINSITHILQSIMKALPEALNILRWPNFLHRMLKNKH